MKRAVIRHRRNHPPEEKSQPSVVGDATTDVAAVRYEMIAMISAMLMIR